MDWNKFKDKIKNLTINQIYRIVYPYIAKDFTVADSVEGPLLPFDTDQWINPGLTSSNRLYEPTDKKWDRMVNYGETSVLGRVMTQYETSRQESPLAGKLYNFKEMLLTNKTRIRDIGKEKRFISWEEPEENIPEIKDYELFPEFYRYLGLWKELKNVEQLSAPNLNNDNFPGLIFGDDSNLLHKPSENSIKLIFNGHSVGEINNLSITPTKK